MNHNTVLVIESFIQGFLVNKPGVKLYSVETLGGHDSGKVKLNFYKLFGETQSKVFLFETISIR